MHHPGPPRFCAVGDFVELAPRDPDPDASYSWLLADAPADATLELSEDAVQYVRVDAPGTFVVQLDAPDGTHSQTIRVFEDPDREEAIEAEGDAAAEAAEDGAAGAADEERPEHVSGAVPQTVGPPEGVSGVSGVESGGDVLTGRQSEGADEAPEDYYAGLRSEQFPEQSGEGGRPRIQLRGRVDEDGDVLVEADPQPHPYGDETASDLDVEFVLDDRDPITAEDVTIEGTTLRIPEERVPERARVHAVSVGEHGHSVADVVDVRLEAERGVVGAGPDSRDVTVDRPYEPPAWSDDVVIYEVYVRTFADDEDQPSTFDAIAEKFDHLESLGVDVLWLTPVLENDHAPHGYNITDFYSIADDLGSREDYRRFVERAHDRGFAVLFDLVCNHTARDHPYFRDAYGDPDSEYYDWYDWQDSGEPETYFDWEYIANLDFSHLPVRRHLLDAVDQWFPLVDGFRIDMAWAVPNGFWRELRDRVKQRDSEFLLLDETIPYIPDFQEGMFDVHFDSTTYAMLRSVGSGWAPASDLLDAVEQRTAVGFPDHAGFMLYQENHDEERYRVECGRAASMASAGALCTLPGAPLIYAGQELGQLGKRDEVVWDHTDAELLDHYRRLTAARHQIPALGTDASLERVGADVREGDAESIVAFRRSAPTDADSSASGSAPAHRDANDTTPVELGAADPGAVDEAVVVLNFAEEAAVVDLDADVATTDAVSGASLDADDGLRVDHVAVLPADGSD